MASTAKSDVEEVLRSRSPSGVIASVDRTEWGRIVTILIRLVGDFDLAEEAAQEVFAAAVHQWEGSGILVLPRAWIIRTARYKAMAPQPPAEGLCRKN